MKLFERYKVEYKILQEIQSMLDGHQLYLLHTYFNGPNYTDSYYVASEIDPKTKCAAKQSKITISACKHSHMYCEHSYEILLTTNQGRRKIQGLVAWQIYRAMRKNYEQR